MFWIGCNYWASNSGTEMWRCFDSEVIERDFKLLSESGIKYLRIFPNWRDFQPIKKINTYKGQLREYVFSDGSAVTNPYGLDYGRISDFTVTCEIAEKYGLKLIVSLLTGWMSGILLVPPALEDKNLLCDSEALMWEERFVKGFVTEVKNCRAVIAWDLGNECNCMSAVTTPSEAYLWTSLISNTIRSADNTRPVLSGMSDLSVLSSCWNLRDHGSLVDMFTPHLYYTGGNGGTTDKINDIKTTYIASVMCRLYSDVGEKPALLEEIGTLNKVYADDKTSADCLRVNMLSCWAKGVKGFLWWCAFDQKNLDFPPYNYSMRELGLFDEAFEPKLAANELKRISEVIENSGFSSLPEPETDAVCIISFLSDSWKTASSAAVLAYQNSVDIKFRTARQSLPDAKVYLLPCIEGWNVMPKETFNFIIDRVYNDGAVLYVSSNDGVIENFEEIFGLRCGGVSAVNTAEDIEFKLCEEKIKLDCRFTREMKLTCKEAEPLAVNGGNTLFSVKKYGRGKVYFLSFPLENMLWGKGGAFCKPYYKIYTEILSGIIKTKNITSNNPAVCITEHNIDENQTLIIAVNHSDAPQKPNFTVKSMYEYSVIYGDDTCIPECDAVILLHKKGNS